MTLTQTAILVECKHKTASPDRYGLLKEFAKHNRREMTQSETILWNAIRKEIRSYKFRRQHPIGDYIADFFCTQAKLVIEVDGGYHDDPQQQQEDHWRTEYLNSKGFKVIRFKNEEVNNNIHQVISKIKEELSNIEENYE